jgi:thiol-disulfide isomerase/thioredoxin
MAILVFLSGCGRSLSQQITLNGPSEPDREELNADNPGQPIDVKSSLAYGKYTVVDFYSPYCGPCMQLKPEVEKLAIVRRDIAIRIVNINRAEIQGIDWSSPVAKQFHLGYVPYFQIYGPDGKLMSEGRAAKQEIIKCIEANTVD